MEKPQCIYSRRFFILRFRITWGFCVSTDIFGTLSKRQPRSSNLNTCVSYIFDLKVTGGLIH